MLGLKFGRWAWHKETECEDSITFNVAGVLSTLILKFTTSGFYKGFSST